MSFWTIVAGAALMFIMVYYYAFVFNRFRPKSIARKRVLVTGSSSGIGEQIAYFYSRLGARLVITALEEHLLMEVASQCQKLGARKVEYVVADMTVAKDRIQLVQETERHLGGLDHLILNHGIMSAFLWKASAENVAFLERQMSVNFISYVDIASKCSDMLKASKGNIGVVASGASGMSFALTHTYSATKSALDSFFSSYREELQLADTGISVTIAYPGFIATTAATNILKRAFGTHFGEITPPSSVVECATIIATGVCTRKRDVIFPFRMRIGLFLHKIMPTIINSYGSRVQYSWVQQ